MAHEVSVDGQGSGISEQVDVDGSSDLTGFKGAVIAEISSDTSATAALDASSAISPSNGRLAALSPSARSARSPSNAEDGSASAADSNELWEFRRRTQSDSNLRVIDAASGSTASPVIAGSPTHSESSLSTLHGRGIAAHAPPPMITVTTASNTRPSGLLAMGESFLAGMADIAGLSSPRGAMETVDVVYDTPGPLFVDLFSRDDGSGAQVKSFRRKPDGSMADAEASGRVFPNDELVAINAVSVTGMVFAEIIQTAKTATFPLTLTFHCYQKNREDHERLLQQQRMQPPQRKTSSGPLPPISPSSSSGTAWSAKLNQMTRSGSFERKSDGGNGVPRSPTTTSSAASETSTGKFGISLDKVRNTGTDGMKSLFRIMGNRSSRPEEDKETVRGWMANLALKPHNSASTGGRHRKTPGAATATAGEILHSTPIMAVTTGGRFVGVLDEDLHEFALTWYRKTPPDNDLRQIKGVKRCPYFPSVDDVGAILSLQCESLRFPQFTRVVEMPKPLVLDPAVGNMVDVLLDAGSGAFSATLASNEHDSFQVKISAEAVTLVKISEQEDEAGVVVSARYDPFLQVLVDPADQLRFTLKVQEFGGFLGNREGDVCDLKKRQTQLSTLSCFFLVAQNPQHRDILTLLIRKFRSRVLTPEQEEQAQRDERNLFMDPAFVAAGGGASSATKGPMGGTGSTSSAPILSPASTSVGTGETASSVGSPTTVTTPASAAGASPIAGKTRPGRLLSEGSSSSINARFSDMFGLDLDSSEQPGNGSVSGATTPAATPPRSAAAVRNGFSGSSASSNDSTSNDAFVQGRLTAQEKEIAMLQDKLSSLSVLLKAADQEKVQVAASLEVKDKRIELQQMKIQQLEKLTGHCNAQTRELQTLRAKLEDEERRHGQCRQELQQVTSAASKRASEVQSQGVQTEAQFLDGDTRADVVGFTNSNLERDAWLGGVATVSADDLQKQIKDQQTQIARLEDHQVDLVSERNSFRAKAAELAKELRRLVAANQNRSLDDIESQLAERSSLKTELSLAKAESRRLADELVELKSVLEGLGDKDKGAKRLATQNLELQHTVHQLKDSLSEARDQVDAVKKINSALASRLHRKMPDMRRNLEAPPLHPMLSSDEDEDGEDKEEEEEDDELKDGIAAFRRSLVGRP
ncbi:hypothetical protein BBJ28_00017442 [Nothophytophthora sp. Chile5]|nr:hypothetical protein BBJ28_00017442 [Nothophytophthora sp. Chile5]